MDIQSIAGRFNLASCATGTPDVTALQNNKAYASNEAHVRSTSIPAGFIVEPEVSDASKAHSCPHGSNIRARGALSELPNDLSRISSADLAQAVVINQVDRKFIVCLIGGRGSSSSVLPKSRGGGGEPTLVLVDQHAADERVRVERFLKQVCHGFLRVSDSATKRQGQGVTSRQLNPLKPILLTWHEAQTLAASRDIQDAFRRWGVVFQDLEDVAHACSRTDQEVMASEQNPQHIQVIVQEIPEVVADKVCDLYMFLIRRAELSQLLLAEELRELVKGYLARLAEEGVPNWSSILNTDESTGSDSGRWIRVTRWCPRELLDLINSKACRGTRDIVSWLVAPFVCIVLNSEQERLCSMIH